MRQYMGCLLLAERSTRALAEEVRLRDKASKVISRQMMLHGDEMTPEQYRQGESVIWRAKESRDALIKQSTLIISLAKARYT